MNRKEFLKLLSTGAAFIGLGSQLESCNNEFSSEMKVKQSGVGHKLGHLVRQPLSGKEIISKEINIDILIAGAGISGLSAGYFLTKESQNQYMILEMDEQIGGNSQGGSNEYSKYPFGAHYLPIPDTSNQTLIQFLKEHDIITHFDEDGLPYYNEEAICHAPNERILVDYYWTEGITPVDVMTPEEKEEFDRFFKLIQVLQNEKGAEGKYVFQIPVAEADLYNEYRLLDQITFKEYLDKNNYTSPMLRWYMNYCCFDDYGQGIEHVSAFAGLHYFAARRGKGKNFDTNEILTWDEGNNHLVKLLASKQKDKIYTHQILRSVDIDENDLVQCVVFDWKSKQYIRYTCKKLIMSLPIHVRQKLLPDSFMAIQLPEHQPWIVSTITLRNFEDKRGFSMCWDNVFREGNSVGYINNLHQKIGTLQKDIQSLTIYLPLSGKSPAEVRKNYIVKSKDDIKNEIIEEWKKYYPQIENQIIAIDWMLWGHGMVSPGVNYLCNQNKQSLRAPVKDKIFFAHTDYSGISIFEEAFWQGEQAVKELMSTKR